MAWLISLRHHLFEIVRHAKIIKVLVRHAVFLHDFSINFSKLVTLICRHGIYYWVVVENGHIRVLVLDVADSWTVVRAKMDASWSTVVEMWEGDFILGADLVADNNLINIIELVPVFILLINITIQWLELRTARDGQIECFGGVERLLVEEVEIILVGKVGQKLVC